MSTVLTLAVSSRAGYVRVNGQIAVLLEQRDELFEEGLSRSEHT